MSDYLSLPIHLPDEDAKRFERLDTLSRRAANHVIKEHWTPTHLDGIADSSHQAWKYFDEQEPFEELDLYLPSRFRRCILQKVGETLRSQAERRDAFRAIQDVLPDHKIRSIHRRRIKQELWDTDNYISSSYIDNLVNQLNNFYDRHGRYPDTYFDIQDCPEYGKGVLPFSADDGYAVKYQYNSDTETLTISINTPDTCSPETRGDWSWTEYEREGYEAFHELVSHGELSAPEFQPSRQKNGETYYKLSFPVEVNPRKASGNTECVLALDAGVRKEITAVVVNEDGDQLSTPHFIQFNDRKKMRRLHRERNSLNSQLAELREEGLDHTEQFAHIQSEYERVNNKIQEKRDQLSHDVANQVVALALLYDVDAIVHEDLRSLSPPKGEGELSWELSSWARRDIIENIEYRAALVGLDVERVYPQGTSRSCPRCGSTGHTCKSPDHTHYEVWWGSHFECDNTRCEFRGDRDYVGALNVARVFFSDTTGLDHGFTSSYTGDSETVLASRSVGTRLTFGTGIVAYEPEQAGVTTGGGSAVIAPAVTLSESNVDGSDGRGPVVQRCARFVRCTTENY